MSSGRWSITVVVAWRERGGSDPGIAHPSPAAVRNGRKVSEPFRGDAPSVTCESGSRVCAGPSFESEFQASSMTWPSTELHPNSHQAGERSMKRFVQRRADGHWWSREGFLLLLLLLFLLLLHLLLQQQQQQRCSESLIPVIERGLSPPPGCLWCCASSGRGVWWRWWCWPSCPGCPCGQRRRSSSTDTLSTGTAPIPSEFEEQCCLLTSLHLLSVF